MKDRRAALPFIFVTLLIDVLGTGLIIPVLPKLVAQLGGGGPSHGSVLFGYLLSCYALMQLFFAPVIGSLSDHFGRRQVLLISMFFSAVDYMIMALAPTLAWLFVGRILSGITGASYSAASAYIADISAPEERAKNFGMIGAAFGAGFILGPAAGGLLGHVATRAPFWAAMILSLINFFYGAFILPESLPLDQRRPFNFRSANAIGGLKLLARYPWVLILAGCVACLSLGQQALQSTWVLYTTLRFHWTALDNGLSLSLVGVTAAVVQIFLTGLFVRQLGEWRTVIWGLAINVLGFIGLALADNSKIMVAVIVFWSLSGVVTPSLQSLITQKFRPDEQGAVQGSLASLQSLMGIPGPVLATTVFSYFTSPAAHPNIPGAAYFMGALLTLAAMFLARAARTKQRAEPVAVAA